MSDETLTLDEVRAIDALAAAWNAFMRLPVEHADDLPEFRQIIHAAQDKVLSRPARRSLQPGNAFRRAERALLGERWTTEQARELIHLVNVGTI